MGITKDKIVLNSDYSSVIQENEGVVNDKEAAVQDKASINY